MMRLSRFVHLFCCNDVSHFAVYHAGHIKTVFIEKENLGLIEGWRTNDANLDSTLARDLIEQGFLVDDKQDEIFLQNQRATLKPELSVMYLILTDKCNLGCKYCFVDSSFPYNYKTGSMTWETAHHAFEFFRHNVDRSYIPDIWFYGGEPFLESELLFNLANYISINEPSFSMTVISNGTLITPEIAQQIKAYPNINITVSVDGAKEIHDANRVYKKGDGSEECLSCPALAVCGGGCPYGAMLKYGSIWNIDRRFCIHSKEALEWLIWDLYDKVLERLS